MTIRPADPIDPTGVKRVSGIEFGFPENLALGAGGRSWSCETEPPSRRRSNLQDMARGTTRFTRNYRFLRRAITPKPSIASIKDPGSGTAPTSIGPPLSS